MNPPAASLDAHRHGAPVAERCTENNARGVPWSRFRRPTRPFTATKGHGNPFRLGGNNGGKDTVNEYANHLYYMS